MTKDATRTSTYAPPTDIVEMKDGVRIYMDIPGVSRENLSIDVEGNELMIKGTSSYNPRPVPGGRILHAEFDGITFQRTFTLSDLVEGDKIAANLKDGVLELYLPKAEALKPRRIEISTE